jgi:hypothetical protein
MHKILFGSPRMFFVAAVALVALAGGVSAYVHRTLQQTVRHVRTASAPRPRWIKPSPAAAPRTAVVEPQATAPAPEPAPHIPAAPCSDTRPFGERPLAERMRILEQTDLHARPEGCAWISGVLDDPATELRLAAVRLLESAPTELEWVHPLLSERYPREADPDVRKAMIAALVSRHPAADVGETLTTLWNQEQDPSVRRTIASYIGSVAAGDSQAARSTLDLWQARETDSELRDYLARLGEALHPIE